VTDDLRWTDCDGDEGRLTSSVDELPRDAIASLEIDGGRGKDAVYITRKDAGDMINWLITLVRDDAKARAMTIANLRRKS
jgi:hypothetical protein